MKILNLVWPAIYVAGGLLKLWYFILITIAVEWIVLRYFLRISSGKSILMSVSGNIISGLAGIYLIPWLIFLPQVILDGMLQIGTFHMASWVLSFLLMCMGSVVIEVFFVNFLFKAGFRKLFLPLLIGNVLTYTLLGILALNGTIKLVE